MPDSYFIGYLDDVPAPSRRVLRRTLPILAVLLALSLALLVRAQEFDEARFEFGTVDSFEGMYRSLPYPHLLKDDGQVLLLVGMGKHEVDLTTAEGLEPGMTLRLRGTRIVRGATVMIEVEPGSGQVSGDREFQLLPIRGTTVVLTGEIVGSKCFLGVMNPARGPVHAACARHCMLGGVPAMLYPDKGENASPVLLTGLDRNELARLAARPLVLSGTSWSLPGMDWVEITSSRPSTP
jgi:hypothetical protein